MVLRRSEDTEKSFKVWFVVYVMSAHETDILAYIREFYKKFNFVSAFKRMYKNRPLQFVEAKIDEACTQ